MYYTITTLFIWNSEVILKIKSTLQDFIILLKNTISLSLSLGLRASVDFFTGCRYDFCWLYYPWEKWGTTSCSIKAAVTVLTFKTNKFESSTSAFNSQGPKFGQGAGGMGSVKDRMAFFRKAAEEEQKAKAKQFVHRAPSAPTPVNRFKATTPPSQTGSTAVNSSTSATTPTSPTEKVSLKKAPDPNKTYVRIDFFFVVFSLFS